MWCPSVSLSVWANAWLAGTAAPDDVLDALAAWAPVQAIAAHDPVAAGHAGLPYPVAEHGGATSVLQTLRTAAGAPARRGAPVEVVLPVPGDVRGLPPGSAFARDALDVGEALILTGGADGTAVGLVPDYPEQDPAEPVTLCWTAYSLPAPTPPPPADLGAAEYELRSAVRTAAETLGALDLAAGADADPRALVEQFLDATAGHRVPDHAPARALRVLEQAAHVEAILAVSAELAPLAMHSFSQHRLGEGALRPLTGVVRTARLAALDAILRSAWPA